MLVRSPTLHSFFNSTFGKHRIYSFGMGQTICRSSCLAGSWSPFKTISHIGSWSIQTTSHIGSWSPSKPFRIGLWSPFKTISHIGSWSIQTTSHIGSWSPFKTISHRFVVNLSKHVSHRFKHFGLWSTFLYILHRFVVLLHKLAVCGPPFEHFAYRFSVVPLQTNSHIGSWSTCLQHFAYRVWSPFNTLPL